LYLYKSNDMKTQDKYLNIRISTEERELYKKMCKENGYTLSSRIRQILLFDIELNSKNKNIIKLLSK
jgi:hypothetical protein